MRDLFVFGVVMLSLPMAFRRPFVGMLVFSWLAYMRPQDLCWSFAREMRFSFFVGITMMVGWFVNESGYRRFWRRDLRTTLMAVLAVSMTVSLAFAKDHSSYVMRYFFEFQKIVLVALFTTGQVDTRQRLRMLLWTIAACLAFYGVKNGMLGILRGGAPILRGPGGMLEDNNDFALALVMNIPLLFYLSRSEGVLWLKRAADVGLALTVVTILLTHSRGGFVAMVATLAIMAWRARWIFQSVAALAAGTVLFFLFAPASVLERLATIAQGSAESSAAARLRSWDVAFQMIADHPILGVGIRNFQYHYATYAPEVVASKGFAYVAHNSYLQIWAEGGTIAFVIYMVMLVSVFSVCRWGRRVAQVRPDLEWVGWYSRMFEATTVGFMVGATFLNRGHFDLIYHWVAMVSCLAFLVREELVRGPLPARAGRRGVRVRLRPATAGPSLLPRWGR